MIRRLIAIGACLIAGISAAASVAAHPMPNTIVSVSLDDRALRLDITLPVPDLLLVLPQAVTTDADRLTDQQAARLTAYFTEHLAVTSRGGTRQPYTIQALELSQAVDSDVGRYQELTLRVRVVPTTDFDPRDFTLAYDAIIHQVPTHFAFVQVSQDFRFGHLAGEPATEVGVVAFDFARNVTPPLVITASQGSVGRGFRRMVALGFRHVGMGLDHLLFLVTLLVVAPLRVVAGKWSLFQGWGYAARRVLVISVAFTVGHSVALLLGAYDVIPVPRDAVEMLVAASILLAAVHAIRPLFAGREWLVAGAFGIVHGLAFSERLIGLNLTPFLKAVSVLGFNIGVEGAQLVVMACAFPLLLFSRRPMFHSLRIAAMVCAAVLAGYWMVERASFTL
jgi:hypothetical protein